MSATATPTAIVTAAAEKQQAREKEQGEKEQGAGTRNRNRNRKARRRVERTPQVKLAGPIVMAGSPVLAAFRGGRLISLHFTKRFRRSIDVATCSSTLTTVTPARLPLYPRHPSLAHVIPPHPDTHP
jgi:hypothetical protein